MVMLACKFPLNVTVPSAVRNGCAQKRPSMCGNTSQEPEMKKHSTRAYAPLPPFANHDRALGRALRSLGGFAADAEIPATAALLGAVLFVGLATVGDYGITGDEVNARWAAPPAD